MQINQEVALVEIRDIRANILYSSCNLSEMERLAIVMDTIAKVCLKRFHPNLSTTAEALDLSMVEVFTQTFFLSPLVGWPRILERPDELHDLRFAERNLFFYWNVLPTSRTSAAYVQIQQHVLQQQRLYLLDQLRTNQEFQGGAFRFFAWNESSRDLLPHGRFLPFQGRKLFQRLRTSREPIMSEITVQGNRYLASGFPGGHLGDHHLLALFPASIIDDAMQKLTISFVLGTFIVCLLALIFGFILSESFMRPIQELSAGVLALRERDVSRRVTVLSNDELGAFAVTFNQTLDGLQEMLLAHEVQRQLIPETLPPIPGYQAFLMSHPARDLGGDYCDVQALPDGRFTLVIGDATGHSVGSALVMAMAKACVLDFVLGGIPLSELMKRINTLFYMNLRRKIYMTFFASVLEPATGTLQFSNAGHPFPIMIDIEGNVSRLKLSHPPLGFSPRGDGFQQAEVTIAPGSLVLFFTDIMMEVCNQKGVPWGPRNLIEFVRERRICSAQVIGQELLQFAQTYSGSNSFEDDFTMVILKRDQ
jgi:HAMP domain-containing protein